MSHQEFQIKTLEEYKQLTPEEKDFYHFLQLQKIDWVHNTMLQWHNRVDTELDKKYASKLAERIIYTMVAMVLVAFIGALIRGVIM